MSTDKNLGINEHRISADPRKIPEIRAVFIGFLLSLGLDDREKEGWKLTFTEAVNNAIEHGCGKQTEKSVFIRWWAKGDSVWVETQDEGTGPPKALQENPSLPADPLAESGRGLFIIHNFADTHEHWFNAHGYITRIGKHYKHLNSVSAADDEMEAIMDELSNCYESLSLYDQMAESLLEDQPIEVLIRSGLETFMDSRNYDAIHIEMRPNQLSYQTDWTERVRINDSFGTLSPETWTQLELNESLIWGPKSKPCPFQQDSELAQGACVPILVENKVVGLIAAAYRDANHVIRSNDLRYLKALSDITAITLSHAQMERDRDERKRLYTEINIATKLQNQLLPTNLIPPEIPGYDLFINSISALEVAGDFVEVTQNAAGDYVGCVIDVMGKGVSAAILAGIFRSQFITFIQRGESLSQFLKYTNIALEVQLGEATMFITAFVFTLDCQSHKLTYSAAGHPPALLYKADGQSGQLISSGPPIGIFDNIEYTDNCIQLEPADRLVIVTDGLYEWTQADGQPYGWDAMVSWFEQQRTQPAQQTWQAFYQIMNQARVLQEIRQEDDETILILTRNET